jgi:hypothetical protein
MNLQYSSQRLPNQKCKSSATDSRPTIRARVGSPSAAKIGAIASVLTSSCDMGGDVVDLREPSSFVALPHGKARTFGKAGGQKPSEPSPLCGIPSAPSSNSSRPPNAQTTARLPDMNRIKPDVP